MKKILILFAIAILQLKAGSIVFQDDFENGIGNWSGDALSVASTDRAVSGDTALFISQKGEVLSPRIPIKPKSHYRIRLNSYSTERGTFILICDLFDAKGKRLTIPRANSTAEALWDADRRKQKRNYWMPLQLRFDTCKEAVFARIRIQSNKTTGFWIDDVILEEVKEHPQFRSDASNMSESMMLPGPDGFLYPDFTRAGLTASWKQPERTFKVEEFGAVANDDKDDSDAIERAIEVATESGGGVIEFGLGTYHVSRKISVRADNIILRGVSREKSRIEFGLSNNGIGIFTAGGDNRISPRETVRVFFPRKDAKSVKIRIGHLDEQIFKKERFENLPDVADFAMLALPLEHLFESLGGMEKLMISVEVEYPNNRQEKSETVFILDRNYHQNIYASSYLTFSGRSLPLKPIAITSGLKRGDTSFSVADSSGFKAGDIAEIRLPITKRWNPVNNNVPWWKYLCFRAEVAAVEGKRITLAQPARIDFPLADKPEIYHTDPIRNSGIENITLSQTGEIQIELKMRTVSFSNGFNCRVSDLTVDRPGTSAIYGVRMKNFEMSNCKFTQPWRTKSGGLAYIGWDYSYDCLISNVKSYAMRHAPLFNWSCSGNVVTGGFFNESDAQWHTGFCHENLIDNCKIVTTTNKFKSYGWAFYAVPSDDAEHGGIGPRNVIYNCDATSFRGGIYLGGYNRKFMIMYNKINTIRGTGIIERLGGGDNIIVGNTFILKDKKVPAIFLESLDSTKNIIMNNILYGGNGSILAGAGTPKLFTGNQIFPYLNSEKIFHPHAPVPSIYRYQLEHFR